MDGVLTSSQVLHDNTEDYDDLEVGSRGGREGGLNNEARTGASFYAAYTDRYNGGRKKSRRASASTHTSRRTADIRQRTGWSNPNKKCRLIYATLACIVGIIGISLIVVGVLKEKEYNDTIINEEYRNDNDLHT